MNANTAMRALQVVNVSDSVLCTSTERPQSNQMEPTSKKTKQPDMSEYSQSFKAFSEGVLKVFKELIQPWVKDDKDPELIEACLMIQAAGEGETR